MCSVFGGVSDAPVLEHLIAGLERLEYRGYDSAGVAICEGPSKVERVRRHGEVSALKDALVGRDLSGTTGIAHTRWATHGAPSERNAHPIAVNDRVYVVHNGVIDNFEALKHELESDGRRFVTQTDTEVIAHLIDRALEQGPDVSLTEAVTQATARLVGMYALVALDARHPQQLVAARKGSPMVVGRGASGFFWVASDSYALVSIATDYASLDEGDIATIGYQTCHIAGANGDTKESDFATMPTHADSYLGEHPNYMHKEIREQPDAMKKTLASLMEDGSNVTLRNPALLKALQGIDNVHICACGTSYNAAITARLWLEECADVHCRVDTSSEFRYSKLVVPKNTLFLAISQSGETMDTIEATKVAREDGRYARIVGVTSVEDSAVDKLCDDVLRLQSGREVSVASTKTYTCSLSAVLALALALGEARGYQDGAKLRQELLAELPKVPVLMDAWLNGDHKDLDKAVKQIAGTLNCVYLGRHIGYPVAKEGALKLKELSYLHAEAMPAGELKHGPIALIDGETPVIGIVPGQSLLRSRMLNALHEVAARGGRFTIIGPTATHLPDREIAQILVPDIHWLLRPFVDILPLQEIAYRVTLHLGKNVDKPRNLAKSVTVE